jgi:hypothetical protein
MMKHRIVAAVLAVCLFAALLGANALAEDGKMLERTDVFARQSAIDEALQATICKNLLLCNRQCTDFYLLMLPGDKPFKTSILSKQIGSARLSFAGAEYMEQFLDITPGSLSVLGLMNDKENRVQLLIDKDLLDGTYIGCHPCINTSSLRLLTIDLIEKSFLPCTTVSLWWICPEVEPWQM